MENLRDIDMHLNNEFFKNLNSKMGGFKRQVSDLKKKQAIKAISKPSACPICGASYESWDGFSQRKQYCPSCQKNLDDGFTALVSVDNRYAFVKFSEASEAEARAVAGKVMTIPNERMELIQGTCMWITDDAGRTRCDCRASCEMTAPGDGGVNQTIRLCLKHKAEAEKLAEEIQDEKTRNQVLASFSAIVELQE